MKSEVATTDVQTPLFSFREESVVLEKKVSARREVTGAKYADDPEVIDAIIAAKVAQMPERLIYEKTGVSRDSIRAIWRKAQAEGKVRPFKEEVVTDMQRVQSAGWRQLADAIEEKKINPASLPITLAIAQDKMQTLQGEATEIVEHRHLVVDPREFRAAMDRALDVQATVLPASGAENIHFAAAPVATPSPQLAAGATPSPQLAAGAVIDCHAEKGAGGVQNSTPPETATGQPAQS